MISFPAFALKGRYWVPEKSVDSYLKAVESIC